MKVGDRVRHKRSRFLGTVCETGNGSLIKVLWDTGYKDTGWRNPTSVEVVL